MEGLTVLATTGHLAFRDYIQRAEPNLKFHYIYKPFGASLEETDFEGIENVDVCFGSPYVFETVITKFPNLRWFHSIAAGNEKVQQFCQTLKTPLRCLYTRNTSIIGTTIPEFIIAYILCNEKKIMEMHEFQKQSIWANDLLQLRSLSEVNVGMLGLGVIGKSAAKLCKSMSMRVWGVTRNVVPVGNREACVDEYRLTTDLQEVLSECDYVITALPSTPLTNGYLSGDVLSACKKKPVFINVGRGNIINEDSIINALRQGWISKAVLDVFENEPLPQTSRLWSEPGVFISPHMSHGISAAGDKLFEELAELFLENCRRFVNNRPMKDVTKFSMEDGY